VLACHGGPCHLDMFGESVVSLSARVLLCTTDHVRLTAWNLMKYFDSPDDFHAC